jgi:hypothetical protein
MLEARGGEGEEGGEGKEGMGNGMEVRKSFLQLFITSVTFPRLVR